MNYLLITVAGASRRFNEGEKDKQLKCIYYKKKQKNTLLYHILKQAIGIEHAIVVGGYQYEALSRYVKEIKGELQMEISLVQNPYYLEKGSGYSLKLGLEACLREENCESITFVEGDLFFECGAFHKLLEEQQSCLSVHTGSIRAADSVAVYYKEEGKIKYIYDTGHRNFIIPEAFTAIYNSAQIWKFCDMTLLRHMARVLQEEVWEETNLPFIEAYFNGLQGRYTMIKFRHWSNCNTRKDYDRCGWECEN